MSVGNYIAEPAMQAAKQYQERNRGIPIDPDVAFTDHRGQRKPRIEQRQRKLLNKIGFLHPYLEEDESVVLVTTACSPFSVLEQFLGGWIVLLLKRSLLVLTNKRLFHVPTTPDYKFRRSLAMVDYAWCQDIQVRGSALQLTYHSGKHERFVALDRRESKKLKSMFRNTPLPHPTADTRERTFLCPNCASKLTPEVQPCAACGQSFRDKRTALKLSILVPGGGYFYTGHPILGILDGLVETYLTLYGCFMALGVLMGAWDAIVPFGIFVGILVIEKLVTIYQANNFLNEFLPKSGASPYQESSSEPPAPVEETSPVRRPKLEEPELPELVLRAGGSKL